jgi:hypothetical protein
MKISINIFKYKFLYESVAVIAIDGLVVYSRGLQMLQGKKLYCKVQYVTRSRGGMDCAILVFTLQFNVLSPWSHKCQPFLITFTFFFSE